MTTSGTSGNMAVVNSGKFRGAELGSESPPNSGDPSQNEMVLFRFLLLSLLTCDCVAKYPGCWVAHAVEFGTVPTWGLLAIAPGNVTSKLAVCVNASPGTGSLESKEHVRMTFAGATAVGATLTLAALGDWGMKDGGDGGRQFNASA